MKTDPFNWIDTLIEPIPVIGRLWADALYTVLGVADAMNLTHWNGENAPVPTTENIVELHRAVRAPERLPEAA
jgi:hypothetical protein